MSDARIRLAQVADAGGIAALRVRAWRAAYRGLLPDDVLDALDPVEGEARWRRVVETPPSPQQRTWVLDGAPAVLGFAVTGPTRDTDQPPETGEVYALYLEPSLVGRGQGRLLMQHAAGSLAEQGFRRVSVWVIEGNARALCFYERVGLSLDTSAPPKTVQFRGRDLGVPEVRLVATLHPDGTLGPPEPG